MKYIYILDYERGICEIKQIPSEFKTPSDYLEYNGYFNNIEWMTTDELSLDIQI